MKKHKTPDSSPAKRKLSEWQAWMVCNYAPWILGFFLVATALLIPIASKLKLHANFMDLLPKKHSTIVNLNELMSHVGGTSFLIAIIESPDEKSAKTAADLFSKKAASLKQIDYVDSRTNVPAFAKRKLLFLDLESVRKLKSQIQDRVDYERRKNNPFYLDLIAEKEPTIDPSALQLEEKVSRIGGFAAKNENSFMQVILLKPSHPVSDFVKTEILFGEIKALFAEIKSLSKHSVTLGMTGPYRTRYEEYKTISRDLSRTGVTALILLVLINVIAFRNFRSIVYAYLPLVIGTIWIWAFTQMTIGYLNLITAFLAAILFGMGGDYTYHILTSFEEDYRLTGSVKKAIEMTCAELWSPLWSSMWTTAVVFFAMVISQFEGFRHFGIIAGFGIIISFVLVLFVQPAIIFLGEKYFPVIQRPLPSGVAVSKRVVYSVIIVGVLFTFFSLFQIRNATFDYNFNDLQAKDDDSIELAEKISNHFGVYLTPVIFMAPDREVASKIANQINQYIQKNPKTSFDFAAAVSSHVPRNQAEKIKVLGEIKLILDKYKPLLQKQDEEAQQKIQAIEEQLQPTPFTAADLPDGVQEQYEGKEHKISAVFVYPNTRIFNGLVAARFIKEARDFPVPDGVKLAGEPLIYVDILALIMKDTPIVLGVSTIIVFLLVLFYFKRLDHALWVHAPLAIGILWMIGMMGAGNLKFNFFNILIIPAILGVGIDNGIYIFDRYIERKGENFFETMRKSLKGVLLASATNISGFASIMFVSHQGMASMGKLGFFGFLSCLLSSVFFIPALIEFYEFKYKHPFRRNSDK